MASPAIGQRLNTLGLRAFFRLATAFPRTLRWTKPLFIRIAFVCSPAVRQHTAANARMIFGPSISPAEARRFGIRVLGYFFDFVMDVSFSVRATPAELNSRIAGVDGHDQYMTTRLQKRGAILLTAHMGSFELGIAALKQFESRMHVVFKRDTVGQFEQLRGGMRKRLGVMEAPVDEGWAIWMRLRDALRQDDVVLIQGDRVMPGQRGVELPFCHGRLSLPTGPVKLASASGAPIVAVFSVRDPDGRVRLIIDQAIDVPSPLGEGDLSNVMQQIAAVLERYVRAYPEQWLVLNSAFSNAT